MSNSPRIGPFTMYIDMTTLDAVIDVGELQSTTNIREAISDFDTLSPEDRKEILENIYQDMSYQVFLYLSKEIVFEADDGLTAAINADDKEELN